MLAPLPYALRILLIHATRCGGEGAADELIEFLQQGCGAAPRFDVGLRRRNNELRNCCKGVAAGEELKEFLDFSWARDWGEAL